MSSSLKAALDAAEQELNAGNWITCLALLQTAEIPSNDETRRRRQLQALAHIYKAADTGKWAELLGIDISHNSPEDVRRNYKRLAALIHPDKCSVKSASDGFNTLTTGAKHLQTQLSDQDNLSRKKQRLSSEDLDLNENLPNDIIDGSCFPWWSEWDDDVKQEDDTDKTNDTKQAAENADLAFLNNLTLQELQTEVNKRKEALLENPIDEETGQRIAMSALNAALRRARSQLNCRLQDEKEQPPQEGSRGYDPTAALDGGFL